MFRIPDTMGFLLLVWLVLTPTATSSLEIDVTKGEINGKTAVSFWVFVRGAGERVTPEDLLDPAGLQAHLIPASDPNQELVYPCGQWVSPPPGKYKYWLEGRDLMTPASYVMGYAASPFRGKGMAVLRPLVTAGRIALASTSEADPRVALRLLHTESHNRGGAPKAEVSRQVFGDQRQRGVLMPEGRVVAGLFDIETAEYLALARPADVFQGSTTRVDPRPPPRNETDLLVVLERPELVSSFEHYDIEISIVSKGEGPRQPDLVVPTNQRIFAIWYRLPGQVVTLKVASPSVFLKPEDLFLRPAAVVSYRGRLRSLPNLDVDLKLPEGLSRTPMTLKVLSWPENALLEEIELPPGTDRYRFERVPAEKLVVELDVPPAYRVELPDLSDGADESVVFEPRAIEVSGTVFRGSEPHPATVKFGLNRGERYEVQVDTDDEGFYRAPLIQSGHFFAYVQLRHTEIPPFAQVLSTPFREDTVVDFHIPSNQFRIRVVDSTTAEGIADAEVVASNNYLADGTKLGGLRVYPTDAEGWVNLAPLRPGELVLHGEAEGYLRSEKGVPVREEDEEREIVLYLDPVGEVSQLRITLLAGSPAAGTQAVAFRASVEDPRWRGEADTEGVLRVPDFLQGDVLVLKHPASGLLIRRFDPAHVDIGEAVWILPNRASPLSMLITTAAGEPASRARMTLWVDGTPLRGTVLQWLFGASSAGPSGRWTADGLPAVAVHAVAWIPGEDPAPTAEMLYPMATMIRYPSQGIFELEAIR